MTTFRKSAVVDIKTATIDNDGYSFKGYASVFDGVDSYGDTITKGAFSECLETMPKMFFNHDSSAVPIGKWTLAREDEIGLYVEGELTKGIPQADAVAAALAHGTVDGLSIGFTASGEGLAFNEDTEGFVISKVDRLFEISVVTFPADNSARIAKAEGLDSVKSLEDFLRDAGGLSRGEAKAFISSAKAIFERERQRDADLAKKAELDAALSGFFNSFK